MKLPLQVIFRDMPPSPALEGRIRERAARLERFAPELMSCQVVVETSGKSQAQGHRYVVRIDARLPGTEIVAGEKQGNQDIGVALRDAFDAATRQIEDHVQRRRDRNTAGSARAAAEEGGPTNA